MSRSYFTQDYFDKKENAKPKCYDTNFDPLIHPIDPDSKKEKTLEELEFWHDCLRRKVCQVIRENPSSSWALKKQTFLRGMKEYIDKKRMAELNMNEEEVKKKNEKFLKESVKEGDSQKDQKGYEAFRKKYLGCDEQLED